jgi:hypothetical protein
MLSSFTSRAPGPPTAPDEREVKILLVACLDLSSARVVFDGRQGRPRSPPRSPLWRERATSSVARADSPP